MSQLALATALRTVVSNLHKRLRKQMYSADGYSMTELHTLLYLSQRPSCTPSELAELAKVKAQSMTKVLQKLEAAQFVQRTPQAGDKRKVAVALTEAGRRFGAQIRYERDEWLAGVLESELTAAQRAALAAALPILELIADADSD